MPTLALSNNKRGFTLLELMVVMMILGMITTIAYPQLDKMINSASSYSERTNIAQRLTSLPMLVRKSGKNFSIQSDFQANRELNRLLGFPIRSLTQIVDIFSNGVCTPGVIEVLSEDFTYRFTLSEPYCVPTES